MKACCSIVRYLYFIFHLHRWSYINYT